MAVSTYAATPAGDHRGGRQHSQELQRSDVVWEWFSYVLLANLLLVVPLLWLAAYWSLRPIKALVNQVGELENGERDQLDENLPSELRGLVRNLNILVRNAPALHQVSHHPVGSDPQPENAAGGVQSTLRSLRSDKQTTIEEAEPIMLDHRSGASHSRSVTCTGPASTPARRC